MLFRCGRSSSEDSDLEVLSRKHKHSSGRSKKYKQPEELLRRFTVNENVDRGTLSAFCRRRLLRAASAFNAQKSSTESMICVKFYKNCATICQYFHWNLTFELHFRLFEAFSEAEGGITLASIDEETVSASNSINHKKADRYFYKVNQLALLIERLSSRNFAQSNEETSPKPVCTIGYSDVVKPRLNNLLWRGDIMVRKRSEPEATQIHRFGLLFFRKRRRSIVANELQLDHLLQSFRRADFHIVWNSDVDRVSFQNAHFNNTYCDNNEAFTFLFAVIKLAKCLDFLGCRFSQAQWALFCQHLASSSVEELNYKHTIIEDDRSVDQTAAGLAQLIHCTALKKMFIQRKMHDKEKLLFTSLCLALAGKMPALILLELSGQIFYTIDVKAIEDAGRKRNKHFAVACCESKFWDRPPAWQ